MWLSAIKLGYKTNTQKSEDLDMSISNNMSTKSTGI